jgi:hypothetical protein
MIFRRTALTRKAGAGNPVTYVQHKAGPYEHKSPNAHIHAASVLFPEAAAKRGSFPETTTDLRLCIR